MMEINGKTIDISNPGKVLFPEVELTKMDIIQYYLEVSEFILPHLKGRLIMMQRFPDGIQENGFYQKDVPDYFPEWINRETVRKKEGGQITQLICDSEETLAYVANQACITWHTWLSKAEKPDHPDKLILDLDPPGGNYHLIRKALPGIRDMFENWNIISFLMTTGSTGLHIVIPVDARLTFENMKKKSDLLARKLVKELGKYLTAKQSKQKRKGKIYLDTQRNSYAQTGVAPYSLRPYDDAPVATPVTWKEGMRKDMDSRSYHIKNIFRRLAQVKDPWSGIYHHQTAKKNLQSLHSL